MIPSNNAEVESVDEFTKFETAFKFCWQSA